MKMNRMTLCALATLTAGAAFAGTDAALIEKEKALIAALPAKRPPNVVCFHLSADHADNQYRCGEPVTFTVKATYADGTPVRFGKVISKLDHFGYTPHPVTFTNDLAAGNVFTVKGKGMAIPGAYRMFCLRKRADGQDEGATWGVMYDAEKITPGSARPADFDAYWDGEVARLDREVPIDLKLDEKDYASSPEVKRYVVSVASFKRRVYGLLSVPTAPGKYPVRLNVPGAGIGNPACWGGISPKVKGEVSLTIVVHEFYPATSWEENGRLYKEQVKRWDAKYHTCKSEWMGMWQAGIGVSREDYFYHDVILGANRMLNWLCSQPYCDLSDVAYSGQSQGGAFGIFLSALNTHVTRATISEPALTGLLAMKIDGRSGGWPGILVSQPADQVKTAEKWAPYFDAAHFAPRIKCPVRFGVGLIDFVCPPHCVYSAYNALPKGLDKKMTCGPGVSHGGPKGPYDDYHKALEDSWK